MKKILLFSFFGISTVFLLAFFINYNFNKFVINHLASVIGINVAVVYDYQLQKGLRRELAVGDSGDDVKLVQAALHALREDFSEENITGYFGKITSQAVSEFQEEQELPITGRLDSATLSNFNAIYFNELCPAASGDIISDAILIRVNKKNALPHDYIPKDLVNISTLVKTTSIICIKQYVVPYLKNMMEDAQSEGVQLVVASGFRRPEIQGLIYKIWEAILGEKVKEEVAEPLHSEHQLGTTLDFAGASNNYIGADGEFDETPEDLWLKENSYKYGFVMSYPENKSLITGYVYEPWHYRFVGIPVAKIIYEKQISVEEYFNDIDRQREVKVR